MMKIGSVNAMNLFCFGFLCSLVSKVTSVALVRLLGFVCKFFANIII